MPSHKKRIAKSLVRVAFNSAPMTVCNECLDEAKRLLPRPHNPSGSRAYTAKFNALVEKLLLERGHKIDVIWVTPKQYAEHMVDMSDEEIANAS